MTAKKLTILINQILQGKCSSAKHMILPVQTIMLIVTIFIAGQIINKYCVISRSNIPLLVDQYQLNTNHGSRPYISLWQKCTMRQYERHIVKFDGMLSNRTCQSEQQHKKYMVLLTYRFLPVFFQHALYHHKIQFHYIYIDVWAKIWYMMQVYSMFRRARWNTSKYDYEVCLWLFVIWFEWVGD